MESITVCLIFREINLLATLENAMQTLMSISAVVTHEIVHQWAGDLVSPEWWSNLWLNEGFATFMSYFVLNRTHPDWDYFTQFDYYTRYSALLFDSSNYTHSIYFSYESEEEILGSFDTISYEKAGNVIRTLLNYIGEDSFKLALNKFYTDYANQSANSTQFIQVLKAVVPEKNIESWMNQWLMQSSSYKRISLSIYSPVNFIKKYFFVQPIIFRIKNIDYNI
jgi:aminopeptidase N